MKGFFEERWQFPIGLNQKINKMKRRRDVLNDRKEDTISSIKTEMRPGKKVKKEIYKWLDAVERVTADVDHLVVTLKSQVGFRGFVSRGFLQNDVAEKTAEVEELYQQIEGFNVLVMDDPMWIGQDSLITTLIGELPKKLIREIWMYLMDDRVSRIGVWGMGGVGKTAVMSDIINLLLDGTIMFNRVICVTVSQAFNITELQNDIVRALKVSLFEDDHNKTTRARKLCKLLTNLAIEGRYVLILDDLWDKLSLEDVGIPEPSNGCKLVVTTRSPIVCRYLDCQEIEIPCLPRPDAWNLFLKKVGQDILNHPNLLPAVKMVANECCGLPIAITTIAASMRGERDTSLWMNVLHDIKKKVKLVDVEEQIFQNLQLCYDYLGDENLKRCFLCCALYPEDYDIHIDQLINLWIAKGYIEEMNSKQAQIDSGHAILNELKSRSLIEEDGRFTVKMHYVVRDLALRITSELDASPNSQLEEGGPSSRGELEGWTRPRRTTLTRQMPCQIPGLDYYTRKN